MCGVRFRGPPSTAWEVAGRLLLPLQRVDANPELPPPSDLDRSPELQRRLSYIAWFGTALTTQPSFQQVELHPTEL